MDRHWLAGRCLAGLARAPHHGLRVLAGIAFTLTRAIERDRAYRLIAVGPYDSAAKSGVFAISRQA